VAVGRANRLVPHCLCGLLVDHAAPIIALDRPQEALPPLPIADLLTGDSIIEVLAHG